MKEQLIISIGREFGSGGHEIAEILADQFSLTLYDKNLLEQLSAEWGLNPTDLEKYDEKPKNVWLSRSIKGYTNSMEENLANLQFRFLKEKATAGASFIVVGRCGETILRRYSAMFSVFILGDWENKKERISRIYDLSPEEAEQLIIQQDSKRKTYHNYYCQGKWGDSRNYDLSINSSTLGVEGTAELIAKYILLRKKGRF